MALKSTKFFGKAKKQKKTKSNDNLNPRKFLGAAASLIVLSAGLSAFNQVT